MPFQSHLASGSYISLSTYGTISLFLPTIAMYKSFLMFLVATWNSQSVASFGLEQSLATSQGTRRASLRRPLSVVTIRSSSLGYRHGNEELFEPSIAFVPPSSTVTGVSQETSSSAAVAVDPKVLPRHSPPADVVERQNLLWDVELTTGRVAMVAAILLFLGEISSGLSISEQIMNLF